MRRRRKRMRMEHDEEKEDQDPPAIVVRFSIPRKEAQTLFFKTTSGDDIGGTKFCLWGHYNLKGYRKRSVSFVPA